MLSPRKLQANNRENIDYWPLINGLKSDFAPDGAIVRNTSGTVIDHEGLAVEAPAGAERVGGGRLVKNDIPMGASNDLTVWSHVRNVSTPDEETAVFTPGDPGSVWGTYDVLHILLSNFSYKSKERRVYFTVSGVPGETLKVQLDVQGGGQ